MTEERKKSTESFLDERWTFTNMEDSRPQDVSYYNGAVACLEFLGYSWRRNSDGKHYVYE